MAGSIYLTLLYNVTLLLAMGLIYEVLLLRWRQRPAWLQQAPEGLMLGLIGIAVMLTPWEFYPGLVFDSRSILLSIAGLFFGGIPTAMAMAMTAGFRLYQGGDGAVAGITTILATGAIGLAWGRWRRGPLAEISWGELYIFGFVVHIAMLLAMLTLPWATAQRVLGTISEPVLVLYPLGTAILGALMANLLRYEETEDNLRESEARYRLLFNSINDAVYVFPLEGDDRPGAFIEGNEPAWRRLGYSREELLGLSPLEINAQKDEERIRTIMRRLKQEGQAIIENVHLARDGRAIPVEINARLFELKGRPTVLSIVRDITERKRAAAEEAANQQRLLEAARSLERSRNMLQLIIDSIPIRVFWKDRELRYLGCNSLFASDAGFSKPEELLGKDDFVMGWREQADLYRADDLQVMESRRPKLNIIEPQTTPSGGTIWLDTSKVPLQAPDGEVFGVLGVYADVTERMEMEEALRITRENLELALKGAELGTWDWNITTGETTFNDRWAEMLGYRLEELETHLHTWENMVHLEDMPGVMEILEDHLQGITTTYEAEYRLRHKSGDWVWVFDKGKVIARDAEGRALRACGIHQDISQRKEAEAALQESQKQLKEMHRLAKIGIWDWLVEPDTVTWSEELYEIFGRPKNAPAPTYTELAEVFDPESWEILREAAEKAIRSGEPYELELKLRRPDGTTRWVIAVGGRKYDNLQRVTGLHGTVQDITERKLAEEEKERLEAQLAQAQKMEAVGTLAGGIAHDFNNILWAIMGFAELSLQEVPEGSHLADNLQQVVKASQRAKDLVNQILTFSRRQEQERKPLQIGLIIKEALKLLRATIPTTIDIRQNIFSPEAKVLADPTQIHQLIVNLCANAAHAMREQGGTLEIRLEQADLAGDNLLLYAGLAPGPYVILTVRDTGPGIAPEIIDKIFEPFFTTKGVGEGTGMGLAVVYGIVKSHGGGITVSSQPGEGASFTIVLPEIASPAAEDGDGVAAPRGEGRLLVIDDEPTLVEMVKDMLEILGYEVSGAHSGPEGLEIFQSRPDAFDLIVTDQTMPHLTGLQLAREVRRIRPEMPIILCTGFSDVVSEEAVKEAGIKQLLMKPISLSNLGEAVSKALHKK